MTVLEKTGAWPKPGSQSQNNHEKDCWWRGAESNSPERHQVALCKARRRKSVLPVCGTISRLPVIHSLNPCLIRGIFEMYINWTRHVLLGMVPYRCRAWPEVFIKASVPHGKKVRLSVKQIITLFFAFRRLPRLTEAAN